MALERDRLERIRSANRLEDIAGQYTTLQSAGPNRLKGRCPFHPDDTPSFFVYVDQQSWWCYGCQAGSELPGRHDVFKFVMLAEKVGFGGAVDRLAAGVPAGLAEPPAVEHHAEPEPALSDADIHLITVAADVYHTSLLAFAPALEYLSRRGLDMDTIRRQRIGYAAGDRLRRYLRFRGWDEESAARLKLVRERGGREHLHDRIIIPEWRQGKAVYLAGRALGSFTPKYLFLEGAPKPLYGLEHLHGQRRVFVTEGVFDWLALVQWGYPAVCLLGTWLKRSLESLFDAAERIYLAFDADRAGQEATERFMQRWPGRAVALPLPESVKDIGELAERPGGRDAFRASVAAAAVAGEDAALPS